MQKEIYVFCNKCQKPIHDIEFIKGEVSGRLVVRARCHGERTSTEIKQTLFIGPIEVSLFERDEDAEEKAELDALGKAVDQFGEAMKKRLTEMYLDRGWDGWQGDGDIDADQLAERMLANCAKAYANHGSLNLIDTANLAMFVWRIGRGE